MARFPFRPGAGAKAIRNPVYWSRLALQESGTGRRISNSGGRRRGASAASANDWNARWLNLNAVRKEAIAWLVYPVSCDPDVTQRERAALLKRLQRTSEIWSQIDADVEAATKSELRSFASSIRSLIDYVLKVIIRRQVQLDDGTEIKSAVYQDREESFRLKLSKDRPVSEYFLGQPASDSETLTLIQKRDKLTAQLVRYTYGSRDIEDLIEEGPMTLRLNYKHFSKEPEKLATFVEFFGRACVDDDDELVPELQESVLSGAKSLKKGQVLSATFPGGRTIEFYRD